MIFERDTNLLTTQPATNAGPSRFSRGLTLSALVALVMLSAIDKLVFAFAGPALFRDLELTPIEFGLAGSAFFLPYAVAGVAVGILADRVQTRWILAAMSLVWLTAQCMMAFAEELGTVIASRLLLGASTGPTTAVAQHAGFKWTRPQDRMMVSGLNHAALVAGGVVAATTLPFVVQQWGWRPAYFGLAALSALWLSAWLPFAREGTEDREAGGHGRHGAKDLPAPLPSYRKLMLNRTFVAITIIGFVGYVPNVIGFSWLMVYLQQGLRLTPATMASYLTLVAIGMIVASVLAMVASRRALQQGASIRRAMVWPPMVACAIGGCAYTSLWLTSDHVPVRLALYALGATGVSLLPQYAFAIVGHIASQSRRGAMLAIHNGLVTSAGIVGPVLIGVVIEAADGNVVSGLSQFFHGYGVLAILAAFAGLWTIRPEQTAAAISASSAVGNISGTSSGADPPLVRSVKADRPSRTMA